METPSSAFAKLLCVLLKGEKSIPAFNEPHKKQKADTERSIMYARSINFSFFLRQHTRVEIEESFPTI
jgi:hypothetical protein